MSRLRRDETRRSGRSWCFGWKVKPQSSLRIVSRLPSFFRGTLREDASLLMRTASRLEITSDQPIRFHVDGEPRDAVEHLSMRTRPKDLLVRVAL